MEGVLFTERPNYDGDDNFHNKRDNAGGKRKKKRVLDLPAPIFKGKRRRKKKEVDRKKRKNGSNYNGGSGRRVYVAPIFRGKVKAAVKLAQLQGY